VFELKGIKACYQLLFCNRHTFLYFKEFSNGNRCSRGILDGAMPPDVWAQPISVELRARRVKVLVSIPNIPFVVIEKFSRSIKGLYNICAV
jgi:hypothetical protein